MVFDVSEVGGIGEFAERKEVKDEKTRFLYSVSGSDSDSGSSAGPDGKVFLVVNKNTIELRTDAELRKLLVSKYESVMESRYFGKGGIEIVLAGEQFTKNELDDLVRLSYNLSGGTGWD